MDTGKGYFETAETEELLRKKMEALHAMKIENQPAIFRVGEEIELRGSHMRITKIGKHFMTLKLLPTLKDSSNESA